jgi:hypothetical protein
VQLSLVVALEHLELAWLSAEPTGVPRLLPQLELLNAYGATGMTSPATVMPAALFRRASPASY